MSSGIILSAVLAVLEVQAHDRSRKKEIADAIETITRLANVPENTMDEKVGLKIALGRLHEILVAKIGKRILAERENG